MCIMSINVSKLQGYSGSLAVMNIHDHETALAFINMSITA